MTTRLHSIWEILAGRNRREPQAVEAPPTPRQSRPAPALEIAPNDPIVAYFQSAPSVVEVDRLDLDSPALRALKAAGVKIAVPLVSQGELIGLLNLGPRLSEQEYSVDDRRLLGNLSTQAAPALRVAQLVRERQAEARDRERIEQEMRVARLIQQTLLPRELPQLAGWRVQAHYQPARAVGGDFYDFLYFDDGRIGIVIGDVTDKGVPAALVMATVRSMLRTAATPEVSPGFVLERANEMLYPDIPRKMFVTCLYAILDPASGHLRYANAGHDLPYRRTDRSAVAELRATGMPLGLLPGMRYEEKETIVEPGDCILFYSDGLVEAHNPQREMFGFPYLGTLMERYPGVGEVDLIDFLLAELASFTGPGWEQEDDVTLVTLRRYPVPAPVRSRSVGSPSAEQASDPGAGQTGAPAQESEEPGLRSLARFTVSSEPGNERLVMLRVADAVGELGLSASRLEQLKTAVAEAAMNAIEHGNRFQSELPVSIDVLASATALVVRITDQGGGQPIPESKTAPDLEAKLAGLQSPRGWGLFLIRNMVDDMRVMTDDTHHTIELILSLEGGTHAAETL